MATKIAKDVEMVDAAGSESGEKTPQTPVAPQVTCKGAETLQVSYVPRDVEQADIETFFQGTNAVRFRFQGDIKNWIRNIEQHASDNVNKILVGNKADMDESKRAVPTAKGQALADEYGIKFFETSAKTNLNVEQVFFSIASFFIKQRLADNDARTEPKAININQPEQGAGAGQLAQSSACCGS